MAHFALLDENNIVLRAEAVHNDCAPDEATGVAFLHSLYGGGNFVQTSYNNNIRKKFAGPGDHYDPVADVFYSPQPFPSWTLDGNYDWQPPTPMPEGEWFWDEAGQQWVAA